MKEKIRIYLLLIIAPIMVVASLCFLFFHVNIESGHIFLPSIYLGKTEAEITAQYGDFEHTHFDENGNITVGGYYTRNKMKGLTSTYKAYFVIHFDDNGVAYDVSFDHICANMWL